MIVIYNRNLTSDLVDKLKKHFLRLNKVKLTIYFRKNLLYNSVYNLITYKQNCGSTEYL